MSLGNDPLVPLRALANPLRIRIVSLLTGTSLSATEVADELGIAHASASYHLRQLATAGYLRRVESTDEASPGRGQPPRRYTYDPASAQRVDRSRGRGLLFEATVVELRRRLARVGTQRVSADAEVWVPVAVWDEAVALVDEAVRLVHDKAGPPRADGSVHVSLTAALFDLA